MHQDPQTCRANHGFPPLRWIPSVRSDEGRSQALERKVTTKSCTLNCPYLNCRSDGQTTKPTSKRLSRRRKKNWPETLGLCFPTGRSRRPTSLPSCGVVFHVKSVGLLKVACHTVIRAFLWTGMESGRPCVTAAWLEPIGFVMICDFSIPSALPSVFRISPATQNKSQNIKPCHENPNPKLAKQTSLIN